MVIACGLLISRFSLHLRQYPVTAITPSLWLRRADLSSSGSAREAHPARVPFSNSAPIQNRPRFYPQSYGIASDPVEYGLNSGLAPRPGGRDGTPLGYAQAPGCWVLPDPPEPF